MIELLTVLISLTLAVTGVFLYRDYARFLKGAYLKRGRVVSVQATFSHFSSSQNHQTATANSVLPVAYHPVIEYLHEGEAIRFTAIDHLASAKLHVGDKVQLRIIKTRRKENRACKSLIILVSLITILGFTFTLFPLSKNCLICSGVTLVHLLINFLLLYIHIFLLMIIKLYFLL